MSQTSNKNEQSEIEQGQEVSEHSQSSQWIKVKYAGRKNLCEICDNILAKYTCPKCDMKTCSLVCTRKHKEVKSCSGEREAMQYVSKHDIDEKVVSKDYNFIEDMISSADKVKKVLSGVKTTISLEPRRFKILRNNARQLYNIRLSNGPNILQRHRENISFFFVKTKSIYWVFELLYYQGHNQHNMKTSKSITQPISDKKTFQQILPQDCLDKQLLQSRGINSTKRDEFFVFLQNKQKQNDYSNENKESQKQLSRQIVFSSRIVSGKFTTLYELIEYDTNKAVNQQMRDISVFEFPSLFVVHKSLREEFLNCYQESKTVKIQKCQKDDRNEENGLERERSREKGNKKKTRIQQSE